MFLWLGSVYDHRVPQHFSVTHTKTAVALSKLAGTCSPTHQQSLRQSGSDQSICDYTNGVAWQQAQCSRYFWPNAATLSGTHRDVTHALTLDFSASHELLRILTLDPHASPDASLPHSITLIGSILNGLPFSEGTTNTHADKDPVTSKSYLPAPSFTPVSSSNTATAHNSHSWRRSRGFPRHPLSSQPQQSQQPQSPPRQHTHQRLDRTPQPNPPTPPYMAISTASVPQQRQTSVLHAVLVEALHS